MDKAGISLWVTTSFAGVDAAVGSQEAGSPEISWGDTFFIYDPRGIWKALSASPSQRS